MKAILPIITLLVFAGSLAAQTRSNHDVGLVSQVSRTRGCLETTKRNLKAGQGVNIIRFDRRQSVTTGTIIGPRSKSCVDSGEEGAVFYSLKIKPARDYFVGIGVIGRTVAVTKGVAHADVNGDGKIDYFRSCTSSEGAWLSVWSGKPLKGRRLWHAYASAGYDTVSDCTKKDYDEPNSF